MGDACTRCPTARHSRITAAICPPFDRHSPASRPLESRPMLPKAPRSITSIKSSGTLCHANMASTGVHPYGSYDRPITALLSDTMVTNLLHICCLAGSAPACPCHSCPRRRRRRRLASHLLHVPIFTIPAALVTPSSQASAHDDEPQAVLDHPLTRLLRYLHISTRACATPNEAS